MLCCSVYSPTWLHYAVYFHYNFLESVEFSNDAVEWTIVDKAKFGKLGSDQRVKGKMEKIKQLARKAANVAASDEVLSLREAIQTMRRDIEVTKQDNNENCVAIVFNIAMCPHADFIAIDNKKLCA